MKKIPCLYAFFMIISLSFTIPAIAAVVQHPQTSSESPLPPEMPKTLSLLDLTPLYYGPDDSKKSWNSLSPQDVEVVQVSYDNGYWRPTDFTWVQIHTSWLGDMWIKIENTRLGVIKPLDADLTLAVETPLYDRPYVQAVNGASLSPQTVHAKAEFTSPSGNFAIQIETSWLGDQWLIAPVISSHDVTATKLPDAINPDYGEYMAIKNMQVIKLGERSFLLGQLIIDKEAWEKGRVNYGTGVFIASGKLTFWNAAGDLVDQVPYAIQVHANESSTTAFLLPLHTDIVPSTVASLENTMPFYFGLPLPPPLLTNADPDGKVQIGILRAQRVGDYTVAKAYVVSSGKLSGLRDYRLTLTFYGSDESIVGTAHVHRILRGPDPITITGQGDWSNYQRVTVHIDQVSDELDTEQYKYRY